MTAHYTWLSRIAFGVATVLTMFVRSLNCSAAAEIEGIDFFESKIRPVLVERCYECHRSDGKKAKGGLALDTGDGLIKGGDSGKPAVVPGKPEQSLLIEAVRYHNEDLQMPPKKKLPDTQIQDLVAWVTMGAPYPKTTAASRPKTAEPTAPHWAFVPPTRPAVPVSALRQEDASVPHPLDAFIYARGDAARVAFAPRADARTLIRRATYDLHGLPPTPAEVTEFERAFAREPEAAWNALIDRLLASPRYGERWGRHWLDVARYADTKGYVYTDREDPRYAHAQTYRDWVIRALNEDMPYDLFVKLQIAADQLVKREESASAAGNRGGSSIRPPNDAGVLPFRPPQKTDLAAMGFLTLGRRFLGVSHDIIDDRIDVLTRGFQALTVACARCHDHKYDPIPTSDYYSLYGVFDSTTERLVSVATSSERTPVQAAFEKELAARVEKLESAHQKAREEVAERLRRRTTEYLVAQLDVKNLPTEEFYEILDADQLNPIFVRRWHSYLQETAKAFHPIFAPWHAFAALPEKEFEAQAPAAWTKLNAQDGSKLNALVFEAFNSAPPRSMKEVAERYGRLFEKAREFKPGDSQGADNVQAAATAAIHAVLHAPDAPVYPPMGSLADTQFYFDEGTRVNLGKLWKAIEEWIVTADGAIPHAGILEDREPRNARIFRRGNPSNRGPEVPRRYLEVLLGSERKVFESGSGRLEMAELIASRENPLTARVMVNRVWTHHFGAGLVKTPSDFGTRCEPPTHPELLDYLAVWFMDNGWSLKRLHRFIMLSDAYQRRADSSAPAPDSKDRTIHVAAAGQVARAASAADVPRLAESHSIDPENKFLWRQNRRRVDFEALRDSLLAASGELNLSMGGKAVDMFDKPFTRRRAVYGYIDRQFLPGTLRAFDFANPDLHTPQRYQTTVPQQALFLLNSSFVVERAQALAASLQKLPDGDRVRELYRRAFLRQPDEVEIERALLFVQGAAQEPQSPPPPPKPSPWQYGYGSFDSAGGKLQSFTPLPHFEKESWQGSSSWPDAKFGWLRLTAEGGHPETGRAIVRRWVAPFDCAVKISGQLSHEAKEGDGIRGTLIHNQRGPLASWWLHNQKAATSLEPLELKTSEWLDFVVDCRASLSHDDFKWAPVITLVKDQEKARAAGEPVEWNANKDFAGPPPAPPKPLDPWSALAQVFLVSNEFVFVD